MAEDEREGGVRLVQVEDDRVVALVSTLSREPSMPRGPPLTFDGPDPVDGVLHGLGVELLAVGELQALAEGAPVRLVRGVGELAVLGGVRLGARLPVGKPAGSGRRSSQLPGAVPGRGGIEGARGARRPDDDLLLRCR